MLSREPLDRFARPIGRALIGLFYIVNGVGLVQGHTAVVQLMADKGVALPAVLLIVTVVVWLLGGTCLILGYQVRWSSLVLFLCTIPVTVFIHNFWAATPDAFQNELTHCLKNVAILGALLYLAGDAAPAPRRAMTERWMTQG